MFTTNWELSLKLRTTIWTITIRYYSLQMQLSMAKWTPYCNYPKNDTTKCNDYPHYKKRVHFINSIYNS